MIKRGYFHEKRGIFIVKEEHFSDGLQASGLKILIFVSKGTPREKFFETSPSSRPAKDNGRSLCSVEKREQKFVII